MQKSWIGTSWKMNKTLAEAEVFARGLKEFASKIPQTIQPFVIPPFTAMREVKKILQATQVKVGAQNMHWADEGAWTGEISAPMLKDCGLDLVELGHSERRAHFGETNETVGRKAAAAIHHGLIPLICIGETLAEREAGSATLVLQEQVSGALQFIDDRKAELLFAYEPVWAIGEHGIPASAEYANQQQELIKEHAASVLEAAPPCLYGGSVNPGNCAELINQPAIDGLFIGRSAWSIDGYLNILRLAEDALS